MAVSTFAQSLPNYIDALERAGLTAEAAQGRRDIEPFRAPLARVDADEAATLASTALSPAGKADALAKIHERRVALQSEIDALKAKRDDRLQRADGYKRAIALGMNRDEKMNGWTRGRPEPTPEDVARDREMRDWFRGKSATERRSIVRDWTLKNDLRVYALLDDPTGELLSVEDHEWRVRALVAASPLKPTIDALEAVARVYSAIIGSAEIAVYGTAAATVTRSEQGA